MSVYPEFLEHIHNEGLYVPGYNYEEMYNIRVDALMNNKDSSNNFIYTQQQVTNLYEVLEEFLYPLEMTDLEETETNEPPILTNTYTNQTNQTNQTALQAFNNYIITALNNPNQINQINQNSQNLYNLNYNNLIYYNNT
jgi:hypothetical protein